MGAEVVAFNPRPRPDVAEIRARLRQLAAILRAIETGELLVALPECPVAQGAHLAGLKLLGTVEIEIASLVEALDRDGP